MLETCNAAFKDKYAKLDSKAKARRLQGWSEMAWWHESIANFPGHTGPLRLGAVTGMLAALEPRISGASDDKRKDCLERLMGRIYPMPTEIPDAGPLDLQPWSACLQAWSASAVKLKAENFPLLMFKLLMPLLPPRMGALAHYWPHHADILLDALAKCLGQLDSQSRLSTVDKMDHWFSLLTRQVLDLHQLQKPRLTCSLGMKIVRLIQPVKEAWSREIQHDLRGVINLELEQSQTQTDSDDELLLDACKTQ